MLSGFEKKISDYIKTNKLFSDAARLLLAVSGGTDSVALLHVMHALKTHNVLRVTLHCAHINHQLRAGQAETDEAFVIAQTAKLRLGVTTRRIHVREFAREKKLSIETAARKLRMQALFDIAVSNNCSHIVTGHQKDDNAETVVHRLLRGTGFRGLAGIWPEREFSENVRIARPLLCVTRDEITKYLHQNMLPWCKDLTNADCRYTRNYIRLRLLPVLQHDCNGSLTEQLFELSESAQRFYKHICSHADDLWSKLAHFAGEKLILNLVLFSRQSQPIKIELVRRGFAHIGCGEASITQRHYQGILKLAERNATGRILKLPGGFIVRREYDGLSFSRVEFIPQKLYRTARSEPVIVRIPGSTQFGRYLIEAAKYSTSDFTEGTISKSTECFDLDKIKLPLFVRLRRPGDRFIPLGQKTETKIGKFLTAQKVPADDRQKVLVITDSEKIIWLWPVRMGEQAKITDKTQNVLRLKIAQINK
jgi:tRNA(Ile)-lysidine synthase